jgi:hypothetical protein
MRKPKAKQANLNGLPEGVDVRTVRRAHIILSSWPSCLHGKKKQSAQAEGRARKIRVHSCSSVVLKQVRRPKAEHTNITSPSPRAA